MGLITFLIIAFLLAGLLIYLVTIYNGLVALQNDITKAWANIDVLLKQRHDEIPRLVDVCKGYMQYERETLQTLVSARNNYASASTTGQKALASSALSVAVQKVFAVAENYPDLKGNVSFLELQKRIAELESQIADRREFYNDAINLFNTRIQEVPDAWLANPMGLKPRAMFQATAAERLPATVSLTPSRT